MLRFLKYAILAAVMGSGVALADDIHLTGSGATFPQPLYERWVAEYGKIHTNVKIDYGGGGSGKGIKDISDGVVDFAGSDAPMNKKEIEGAGGEDNLIEFPTCAGGVVPAYNLEGITDLKFDGEVLAGIYMGTIINWNDAKIAALNPGVKLPDLAITPAWRTDGSGTNFVFTNYLATQSDDFKNKIGVGKQVKWPVGQGGKGNDGVTAVVQQTKGAVGYVEQNYADKNKLSYGSVKNKAGKFVKATPDTVASAANAGAAQMNGNMPHANIWNQDGDGAYPIASFTYEIVYKDLKNVKSKEQAQTLVDFLWWESHDAQKFNGDLDYAPLKQDVQKKVEDALNQITYKGEKLTANK